MALLDREAMRSMGDPQWLIDGVLPARAVSMLWGPSGTGKSFWALDMAACVATGLRWNGRKVVRGDVVYIAGEGASGYPVRLDAWEKQHGTDAQTFRLDTEPVRLWSRTGEPTESMGQFIGEVNAAGIQPALIVFDTLGTCLGGADENDNGHMNQLCDAADELARNWGPAVLLIHHTPKGGATVPRGAQALQDRMAMHAVLFGEVEKGYAMLSCKKQKDDELFDPIKRTLHTVELGKGRKSLAFADEHKTGPRDATRQRVTWADIRAVLAGSSAPMRPAEVALALGCDRDRVWQALKRAEERGEVWQPDGNGAYALRMAA